MPLNEAEGYHLGNLTDKQRHEAMQDLYGLSERTPMSPEILSYEDRVRMRRLLDQLDQKDAAAATKEFDLNKPPAPAYVYREFPFLMYHHPTGKTRPARDNGEREQLKAAGWSEEPFGAQGADIPLTAAELAETEELDRELKKKKKT